MNWKLVEYWNEVVKPEDTVYYLGDFSMQFKYAEKFAPMLNGNKLLIAGNHDNCWPDNRKKVPVQAYYDLGFIEVVTEMKLKFDILGKSCVVKLHHMPYSKEFARDKYTQYRPIPEDEDYNFHGHIHTSYRKIGNEVNVGVDVWDFKPIGIPDIEYALQEPDCIPKNDRGD